MSKKYEINGMVYLICDAPNELYKIGVTRKINDKRLKQLQTGNGNELFIQNYHLTRYPFTVESMLHNKFRTKNVLNEWYKLELTDVVKFKDTCNNIENTIDILKDNPYFAKNLK